MEAKAKTVMVCLSEGMTLTINNTQMKLFNAIAIATLAAASVAVAPQAKADYASCNSLGGYTSCYGSNGSSYSSYGIGDNYRQFNGTTSNGDYYSGSCTRIGNYTSCSSY